MNRSNTMPFAVHDIVFHPGFGRVEISEITQAGDIRVVILSQPPGERWVPQWTTPSLLSFEPWPEPVHKRPMLDGYYLVQFKDYKRVYLAQYIAAADNEWALIGPDRKIVDDYTYAAANDGKVKPLAYLGTELKWWQG